MFDPFSCEGPNIDVIGNDRGLVDGLIPAMRVGDRVGLYEAMNPHYSQGMGRHSDWAPFDNGKYVDLHLRHVVDVSEVPSLQEGWAS